MRNVYEVGGSDSILVKTKYNKLYTNYEMCDDRYMEIWDLYDKDENLIGKDWERSKVSSIPDGCYHLACEILVRHIDGDFLITQRDFSKYLWPGHWEATSGGSAVKGETALDCAKRELFEETGILAEDFIEIGFSVEDGTHAIFHSFLTTVSCAKDSVVLQKGETVNYKWISKNELIEFMKTDEMGHDQIMRYAAYVESLKTE